MLKLIAIITTSISLFLCSYAGDEAHLAMRMYSNQLAKEKGDLLTVVISESTSSSKSESIKTSKDSSGSATAPVIGTDTGRKLTRLLNDIEIPGYTLSAHSAYSGSGSASSSDTLSATVTVRIMDVHDNGLLLIRGERFVEMKDEKVKVILTGLVRPKDVSATNSVNSSQISDFKVSYKTEGEVTKGNRPGWFWRFLQFINPF